MLLDKSLSDRLLIGADSATGPFPDRLEAVLGFQISVEALRAYPDAVAETVITVTTRQDTSTSVPRTIRPVPVGSVTPETAVRNTGSIGISLVSMFPQNKTYNVASVSQSASTAGFGALVSVIDIGFSVGKASQKLYLLRDTDTVAVERVPTDESEGDNPNEVRFAWQFRPVLGHHSVEPGPRQVYALLALPNSSTDSWTGKITAVTHWRRYNAQRGLVGEVIPGSEAQQPLIDMTVPSPVRVSASLTPTIEKVAWQDVGQGIVQVIATGRHFLPGTSVSVGGLSLKKKSVILDSDTQLRFRVSALQLGTGSPLVLVNRYGRADLQQDTTEQGIVIPNAPEISLVDSDTSRVTIGVTYVSQQGTTTKSDLARHQPIAIVGNTVFGLSDNPVVRTDSGDTITLSFLAPTKLLQSTGVVRVTEMLWPRPFSATAALNVPEPFAVLSAQMATKKGSKDAVVYIAGSGFRHPTVYIGTTGYGTTGSDPHLAIVSTDASNLDGVKKLIVEQVGNPPVIVALDGTPAPKPTVVSVTSVVTDPAVQSLLPSLPSGTGVRTVVGKNFHGYVTLHGKNLDAVKEVDYGPGKALGMKAGKDGTTLFLNPSDLDGTVGTYNLQFILNDGTSDGGSPESNLLTIYVRDGV